jgi:hypothetical protein
MGDVGTFITNYGAHIFFWEAQPMPQKARAKSQLAWSRSKRVMRKGRGTAVVPPVVKSSHPSRVQICCEMGE